MAPGPVASGGGEGRGGARGSLSEPHTTPGSTEQPGGGAPRPVLRPPASGGAQVWVVRAGGACHGSPPSKPLEDAQENTALTAASLC